MKFPLSLTVRMELWEHYPLISKMLYKHTFSFSFYSFDLLSTRVFTNVLRCSKISGDLLVIPFRNKEILTKSPLDIDKNNNVEIALLIFITQVWVIKKNLGKTLEDVPIPSGDVKNILDEIQFKDELTRSRCRGWLILPSRRYLQADVMFPGCEFDCRLTIRGRTGMMWHIKVCPLQYTVLNLFEKAPSLCDLVERIC